ncbi:MAG: hypothetical protein ACJAYY_002336, partial [Paraglaciecola sp.]
MYFTLQNNIRSLKTFHHRKLSKLPI